MATANDRFADALMSIIGTAEENGATTEEMIETLESTIEMLKAGPQIDEYPSNEYFWDSFDEAFKALHETQQPEGVKDAKVRRCTRDDSYEGISALDEGDSWCAMDESGEWMLSKSGWVYVA